MNTSAVVKTKDRNFSKDLGAINEDWPLLSEISQKQNKLVINKKPKLNVAKTTKEILETSSVEDEHISNDAQDDDQKFEESFMIRATQVKESVPVNDVEEEYVAPKAAPITQEKINKVEKQEPAVKSEPKVQASLKQEIIGSNPLLKLIAIGLTKLYVKKTTTVLNPVKFVADNFREVLVAMLHLGVPALMAWFLVTQVDFIKAQMVDVPAPIFWMYAAVFYFASLFTWVTGQVLVAGIIAMLKNTLMGVARDVAREKDV